MSVYSKRRSEARADQKKPPKSATWLLLAPLIEQARRQGVAKYMALKAEKQSPAAAKWWGIFYKLQSKLDEAIEGIEKGLTREQ